MKKRLIRWVILLAIGFAMGSAIGFFQSKEEARQKLDVDAIALSPDDRKSEARSSVYGSFSLVDHNGKNVTQSDYNGTYKLVFFGFTSCPAVCPTELQKINVIMSELGELSDKITPIFISIDPDRDTVDVIKEYVEQFHPKLVGLTGSTAQIEAVKQSFHASARKVENDMMDGYMMDHSSFLYFMGQDNSLLAMYPAKDSAVKIVSDIKGYLITE